MDRRQEITKYITKSMRGIEVGPWFTPLASKRQGFNCLSLDVHNARSLRELARNTAEVPNELIANIEEVDIVGSSAEIEALVEARKELGTFDYIVSSHNFEHLPNPIKFLQGCSRVLKPGGLLCLAIPDKRASLDYFRPHSTLGQMIEVYFQGRTRPSFDQIFDFQTLYSRYHRGAERRTAFAVGDDPNNVIPWRTLAQNFAEWEQRRRVGDEAYYDAHCWVFTPSSFELVMRDLMFLGLISFERLEVSDSVEHEFFVHAGNTGTPRREDEETFFERRQELLHKVVDELGENTRLAFRRREAPRREEPEKDRLIAELRDTLEGVKRSRSWRITAPMRRIGAGLRAFSQVYKSVNT